MDAMSPMTQSPQEFLTVVRRNSEVCRAHDSRLLLVFFLAVLAAVEPVAAGYWFRGANVFSSLGDIGSFSRAWLGLSVLAGLALAFCILATSTRFHRQVVPKCPRCAVAIRNLDDFLMAMSFPAIAPQATTLRCDVCNHGIAEWRPGTFHAG